MLSLAVISKCASNIEISCITSLSQQEIKSHQEPLNHYCSVEILYRRTMKCKDLSTRSRRRRMQWQWDCKNSEEYAKLRSCNLVVPTAKKFWWKWPHLDRWGRTKLAVEVKNGWAMAKVGVTDGSVVEKTKSGNTTSNHFREGLKLQMYLWTRRKRWPLFTSIIKDGKHGRKCNIKVSRKEEFVWRVKITSTRMCLNAYQKI